MTTVTEELQARLDAARLRRQAAEARIEPTAEALMLEALAAEERAATEAEAVADAVEAHGAIGEKIAIVSTSMGPVILKRSNPVLFKKFMDAGKTTMDAYDKLVRPCIVYPDIKTYDRIAEELPAVTVECADKVSELAGFRAKERSGK